MWQSVKSVGSLLLSFGLLLIANGMFGTLLGLRSKVEGFSTETVGFIMAGFFFGLLLGSLYAVRAVAGVGHIRAFAAFASVMSIAVLGHVLWIDPIVWFGLRLIAGFCMAGMVMVVESWLNERTGNETRGQILAIYMMTNYLSSGMGQFVVTVADPADFQLFAIASIIFSLALVPILLTGAKAPLPSSPTRLRFGDLYKISPVGVIGAVCAGLINSSLNGIGPIFAKEAGLSIFDISTFMACVIMGGMILQFPIGRMSDRFDRRSILMVVTLATTLAGGLVVYAVDQPPIWLFVSGVMFGAFCYTIYPLCAAQINDRAEGQGMMQIAAGLMFAYGVGASMGPILASQMIARFGPEGMFMSNATLALLLAIFTIYRMVARDRSGKSKSTFMPLGGLGLSSKQLYAATVNSILHPKTKSPDSED